MCSPGRGADFCFDHVCSFTPSAEKWQRYVVSCEKSARVPIEFFQVILRINRGLGRENPEGKDIV